MREQLSPRQRRVYDLTVLGFSQQQMAWIMEVGVTSIRFHTRNIFRTLGITSRSELLVKHFMGADAYAAAREKVLNERQLTKGS